jgi:hypothetical protein
MLPLVQTTYFAFGPWNGFSSLERKVHLATQCLFVFVPMALMVMTKERWPFFVAIAIAIVVCLAIVLFQQKGWRYHFVAAHGLSAMLSIMILHQLLFKQETGTRVVLPIVAALTLIWSVVALPAIDSVRSRGEVVEPLIKSIIAKEPEDSRIFILSIGPDYAFYPLAQAGRTYWSRYYSMWMVPGLMVRAQDPKTADAAEEQLARVRREYLEDIQCFAPNFLISQSEQFEGRKPIKTEGMAFLREDPATNRWMADHYRLESRLEDFQVWRLAKPLDPQGTNCKSNRG